MVAVAPRLRTVGRVAVTPPAWAGAAWALAAAVQVRRSLRRDGIEARVRVHRPPRSPLAGRGVLAVVDALGLTCLERCLVLQRWLDACGRPIDVVIGVSGGSASFAAHAWLEGDERAAIEYRELIRIPPAPSAAAMETAS